MTTVCVKLLVNQMRTSGLITCLSPSWNRRVDYVLRIGISRSGRRPKLSGLCQSVIMELALSENFQNALNTLASTPASATVLTVPLPSASFRCTHAYTHTRAHTVAYTYTHTLAHTYTHMYTTHTHTHTHTHTYTYTYIHTHTHTHTHTHIHIPVSYTHLRAHETA